MDATTRRKIIVEKLMSQGSVSVREISGDLHVSLPTARNDLDILEKSGDVIRTFGGAILSEQAKQDSFNAPGVKPYSSRISSHYDSKVKIGKLAAGLVSPYDVIFLDAGTTVFQILKELTTIEQLVVLTNSIYVCTYLMEVPRVTHFLMGGSVKPSSMATIGHKTIEEIKRNKVKKLFLGCDGMSGDGFTVQDIDEAMTKLSMMDIAAEKYLLADSSKMNNPTFVEVAKFDVLDAIITEDGIFNLKNEADMAALFKREPSDPKGRE